MNVLHFVIYAWLISNDNNNNNNSCVMHFCPTLPCYHFQIHWHGSCWWVALCFHGEGWDRGGLSPGARGWCGTGHWECTWQRRTWSREGHSWETAHSVHVRARLRKTHKYFIKHIPSARANICLYTSGEGRWRMQARHRLEFPNRWRNQSSSCSHDEVSQSRWHGVADRTCRGC